MIQGVNSPPHPLPRRRFRTVYTHAIVHEGKLIGFARDLRCDGDTVTALAQMMPFRGPPQTMVMHRCWLRSLQRQPAARRSCVPDSPERTEQLTSAVSNVLPDALD